MDKEYIIVFFLTCFIFDALNANKLLLFLYTILAKKLKHFMVNIIFDVPLVQYKISNKLNEQKNDIQKPIFNDSNYLFQEEELNSVPQDCSEIVQAVKNDYEENIMKVVNSGKLSGTIYANPSSDLNDRIMTRVKEMYPYLAFQNPLHITDFKIVRQAEAQNVAFIKNLYNGDKYVVGCSTSGGTESNILACIAMQNYGSQCKGIRYPVILAPETIHDSIITKYGYFGRIQFVKIDVDTGKIDLLDLERKMRNSNVVGIVGSSPNYCYGVIDPLIEMGQLAIKYDKLFHVDSCMGSLLLPFLTDVCGFAIDGITSLSCDPHKFGFTPKGISILLYKNRELMEYQYFCNPDWTGGLCATPTLSGSRSGTVGVVANCVMKEYGTETYEKIAADIIMTKQALINCLYDIPELTIVGNPEHAIIALKSLSPNVNIYSLSDLLDKYNIKTNKMQGPIDCIHICITQIHCTKEFIEHFTQSIKNCINELKNMDKQDTGMSLYSQAQSIKKVKPDLLLELMRFYVSATLSQKPIELIEYDTNECTDIKSIILNTCMDIDAYL